jgi:hypothetical protein
MRSLRPGLAVAVCSILLAASLLTAQTSPVPAASSGEAENEVGYTSSTEEQDRKDFDRLVQCVKDKEEGITYMEKTAECPYKALSFDGVTHVVCDYSQCQHPLKCQTRCRQATAFLNLDTHKVTKEDPGVKHKKVYIGCIYEKKNGEESTEPTPPVH